MPLVCCFFQGQVILVGGIHPTFVQVGPDRIDVTITGRLVEVHLILNFMCGFSRLDPVHHQLSFTSAALCGALVHEADHPW